MEFAFPKEVREALVTSDPQKFLMPRPSVCVTTGLACVWRPSTKRRCEIWSSTAGQWWCRRELRLRTSLLTSMAGRRHSGISPDALTRELRRMSLLRCHVPDGAGGGDGIFTAVRSTSVRPLGFRTRAPT